jgi:hypothetical protein
MPSVEVSAFDQGGKNINNDVGLRRKTLITELDPFTIEEVTKKPLNAK